MRQKKKKSGLVMLAVLTAVFMLFAAGCEWARDLPEEFEEQKVLDSAKEAIAALSARDYQAVEDMVAEEFKSEINAKMLEESIDETMVVMGEFDSYEDESAVGFQSKNYDGKIAVAVMSVLYENGLTTITISYNTDYEIIGFYMK